MKNLFPFFALFFPICFSSQNFTWAAKEQTSQSSIGMALAKDTSGNLIVASTFSASSASGAQIIKYDLNHNILWTEKIVGYIDYYSLATDANGNIYFATQSGPNNIVGGIYYPGPYYDNHNMLMVKYNPNGGVVWIRRTTGGGGGAMKISLDSIGNVYVAGRINGDLYFDTIKISSPVNYNWIAKYDKQGNFKWVRCTHGNTSFSGYGIGLKTDKAGNSFLTGTYLNSAYFGNIIVPTYGTSGYNDIFLAKIDSSGNWRWVKHFGGSGEDCPYDMDMDSKGNLYITGFFGSSTATFGSQTLSKSGSQDYFVLKIDTAAYVKWAINGGGPGIHWGKNIGADNDGVVYVALNSVYFSKFDSTGTYIGSELKNASANGLLSDGTGCIYITGDINAPTSFGSYNLSPSGNQMYIAQYCNNAPTTIDIKELNQHHQFSVYPNPTPNLINIKFSEDNSGNCLIILRNILGQSVYSECLKDASDSFIKQIDLHNYAKGIYFVEFQNSSLNTKEVKKLVLQ